MSALACGRWLLALAVLVAVGAVGALFYDLWTALVLGAVAVIFAACGWLSVEVHRSTQEWVWLQRRAWRNLERDVRGGVFVEPSAWPSAEEMSRDYLRMIQGGAS